MAEGEAAATSDWSDSGLLLAGHGSVSHPDGALVINRLVRTLRNRNLFAEVETGFLHQAPRLESLVETFSSPRVYVVPFLASHGHTADTVIAERLGLEGPVTSRRLGESERTLRLCEPVGTHASVPVLIGARIAELKEKHALATDKIEILLVGHGTRRNPESARRAEDVAATLRAMGAAARVRAVFLDQDPRVDDWRQMVEAPSVLVVPFLMSSWFHGAQDLPDRLGLDANEAGIRALLLDPGFAGPFPVENRNLWYVSPIGNEPALAETVLAIVREFDAGQST